jgi:2-polyprenyl-3-methyl-5-hydroxy-6-metoxy-1,4-benzoquinol methylase
MKMTAFAPSLDPSEVEKFSKMAAEWWNPKGKFGVLHVFNPVRLQFIMNRSRAFRLRPRGAPQACGSSTSAAAAGC